MQSWEARLDVQLRHNGDKTYIHDYRVCGPLALQKPLYPEDEVCHLYLLHPPAGIAAGDSITTNLTLDDNSHSLLTTPGANKFYRSDGANNSSVSQRFDLRENARLEFLPQESIFFVGARSNVCNRFIVHPTAKMIAWDIATFGRVANGEEFTTGELALSQEIWIEDKPVFIDRMRINSSNIQKVTHMNTHHSMGTMLISSDNADHVELLRSKIKSNEHIFSAVTQLHNIIVIRSLAHKAHVIMDLFQLLWSEIRESVIGRKSLRPRIWNT